LWSGDTVADIFVPSVTEIDFTTLLLGVFSKSVPRAALVVKKHAYTTPQRSIAFAFTAETLIDSPG
jgi:hypothetical protein